MNSWWQLGCLWALAAVLMSLGWRWQRVRANAGIVDVLWAAGVGGGAVFLALVSNGTVAPRVILAVLGGLWGARLAIHLWTRVRAEPEDGRYQNLRAHWHGNQFKFFLFLLPSSIADPPNMPLLLWNSPMILPLIFPSGAGWYGIRLTTPARASEP